MTTFGEWQKAWETEMEKRGYPYARLNPAMSDCHIHGQHIQYGWEPDVNEVIDATREFWATGVEPPHDHDRQVWLVAHEVFVEVDHLRPEWVEASPLLQEMLNRRN